LADLLGIGKSGLSASKKSLEVTSHNIANANTEGYSRQKIIQTSAVPVLKDGLITGTGARVVDIRRQDAPHIARRLASTITENEYYKERVSQLDQVEHIFNEIDSDGLHKILNGFFNSFRELANQPENETIRSVVRDDARMVVKDFHRIRDTLDSLARNIDRKLETEVENINQNLHFIGKLNTKIASLESVGGETGDLRDQRDESLRNLSEYFKVHTYMDEKNRFVVSVNGVGTLVSAAEVQELGVRGTDEMTSSNGMSGSLEIFFKNRPNNPISSKIDNGRVGSLLKTRNKDIYDLQNKMDQIAYDFSHTVNAIHSKGYKSTPVDPNNPEQLNKNTNILFFNTINNIKNASMELELSDAVEQDLGNIVTALAPNSPGDNRIALAISKLKDEKIMDNGTATIEEQFLKSIGNVGLQSGKARLDSEQSEGLLAQAKALKERITGVSIDEEAADMIRFQHAYEASAKVLKTADEMFRTVLDIKR